MNTCPADCAVVALGDRDFIMAPLNFDQLENLAEAFDKALNPDVSLGWQVVPVGANAVAEIVLAALIKHQPELTIAEVKSRLNRRISIGIFNKVLEVSGLTSQGEATAGSRSPA